MASLTHVCMWTKYGWKHVTAEEVAEKLDCSTGHAYKLIRSMNQELKKQGFYVIAGKIPRAFVEQKFFGMTLQAQ